VTAAATRARWLELAGEQRAAREAAELLDQKREVLLRELHRRLAAEAETRLRAAAALERARIALDDACVELGGPAVEAASLAVSDAPSLEARPRSLLGIALPDLGGSLPAPRPNWSPGGTSESLDLSRALFLEVVPILVELARERLAVSNLQRGLARTNRRWNALDSVVLPGLARDLAAIAGALAEEERDDDFRRRRRKASGFGKPGGDDAPPSRYSTTSTFSPRTSLQNRARSAFENSFQPRQGPLELV
jgi:H(+)-transporting ATP synthase subunit D